MDIASAAQVEDVFQALLDYLVEPVLPLKSTSQPDPSLQQSIAKQMHAVVLLYNYYHRRQFPHLELLDFESLCKVAVNAKPNLLAHLNYMKSCSGDGIYSNLSVTEKAIMDACNISVGINTLKDSPTMKSRPVSIVAIFLTDSEIKNCFLQYGTTTQGVWSLIEKSYSECGNGLQAVSGTKQTNSKLPTRVLEPDEAHFRKFALSAVQETTGICPDKITILESHITYSLSKEKSSAWVFIMKCNSVSDCVFEVPIQEVIESLQGPLVKKSCNTYIVAEAVEHFHLLPYAAMIIDWFSREMSANTSVPANEHNISKTLSGRNSDCIISTGKSEKSPAKCLGADFPVLKTNNPGDLDKKQNNCFPVSKHQNSDESRSSLLLHLGEERNSTLEVLDNAVTKFSTECNQRSTKSGSKVKISMDVGASKDLAVMASEKVHGVARKSVHSSIERKCMGNVEILKTKGSIHGDRKREKTVMLKELADIQFPADDNPDRPLHSKDIILLEDAILKVFAEGETSSVIRRVKACQKWGETKDIRDEILSRTNDLLGQSRKRQCVSVLDVNSDIDFDTCNKTSDGNIFITNDDDGSWSHSPTINNGVKTSVGGCGSLGSLPIVEDRSLASENIGVQAGLDTGMNGAMVVYTREEEVQNAVIPLSLPESIVSVGSVSFPQKYSDLYERIVTKFGDVIMQESKEVVFCSDMVSAAMKNLLEVVDSMLQASPGAVDLEVLESWEMKLRFCEFSGLKVVWLRDHFEKLRKIPVVQELEGQAASLEECLEANHKRAADLSKELEQVRAEEKELTEKKRMVDADLEAARANQECFSLDLF